MGYFSSRSEAKRSEEKSTHSLKAVIILVLLLLFFYEKLYMTCMHAWKDAAAVFGGFSVTDVYAS